MTNRVYFRGSRTEAANVARRLKRMLVGQEPDRHNIARGVFLSMGFAALSDIKADFIRKSRGGTGEDGETWPKLSREYLAYGRRFGRGEQAELKTAAGLGKQHRFAPGDKKGLLTAEQLKTWKKLFATYLNRLLLSMPSPDAAARAAQYAWAELKKQGAKTKLEVYGSREVEILRDTNVMFASLSPGELGGEGPLASYTRPPGPGGDQQVFDTIANGVIVGTNVPYAASHNHGDPKRGIPKRQFLPENPPQVWEERWSNVAELALLAGAKLAYEVGL